MNSDNLNVDLIMVNLAKFCKSSISLERLSLDRNIADSDCGLVLWWGNVKYHELSVLSNSWTQSYSFLIYLNKNIEYWGKH